MLYGNGRAQKAQGRDGSPEPKPCAGKFVDRRIIEHDPPEVTTKTVTVNELSAEQRAIIAQARTVADAFRCWEQSLGNEQGKTLGSEAKKLADLI